MKTVLIGLGSQGQKHFRVSGKDIIAIVDPLQKVKYKNIKEVPLNTYNAAIICTPNQEKIPIIEYLLDNKKHIMVEKPLIGTSEELENLWLMQQKQKVALYTAYNYRFEPHIVQIKDILDKETLGEIYSIRIFLGNGTAKNVKESPWRDKGRGVLEEISSHQFDLVQYLLNDEEIEFPYILVSNFENLAYDHVILHSEGNPLITIESTYCYWKNTFTIDITGELGSVHINGLLKWGSSTLRTQKRIFPSGVPIENVNYSVDSDPTLQLQYEYFKELCKVGGTNIDTSIWINNIFNEVQV